MSGVFPSSSSLAACTSAPCASASAISGRLCRREDRWRSAPGWSSLGSSGSEGTSCSISTSPLEDSSDSSSEVVKGNRTIAMMGRKRNDVNRNVAWFNLGDDTSVLYVNCLDSSCPYMIPVSTQGQFYTISKTNC